MLPRLFPPRASRVAGPIPGSSALGLLLLPLLLLSSGALPISIRNEADVAVENGRRHVEAAQRPDGFWTMDGRDTVLPAFAFLGIASGDAPAPLAAAARAALARLATAQPRKGAAAQVGSSAEDAEDALIVAATLSLYGPDSLSSPSHSVGSSAQGLLSAARIRLLRLDSGSTPPATAWLARCALDLIPGRPEQPTDWAPLFSRRTAAFSASLPTCAAAPSRGCAVRDCAVAGYARIRHGAGADTPAAILAHLRWLRVHTGDLFGDATPEDLYFIAVFLDASPPALVATAGISADWRSRIAQRLVASARSDGESGAVWADSDGTPSLRQTLYATATLAALGE